MEKIRQNCIVPSAAYSVPRRLVRYYEPKHGRIPRTGDVIYGEIERLGFHTSLESVSARIHTVHDRSRAVFVFGTRYAPAHYEGLVPDGETGTVDMLARSGIVGRMTCHNELISAPTRIRLLGYVCDNGGNAVNTRDHVLLKPRRAERGTAGARLILCVGTSMNSGKTYAAAACCAALSARGRDVRAAKITGTASLKDILLMQDCGAGHVADFTYFGHPSTYMLKTEELLRIFTHTDLRYGNNPKNYLVVEIADGLFQRETAMLLSHPRIKERIHRLVFCAADAAGAAGGLATLRKAFGLVPHAISGLCSSAPLAIREIASFTDIPVLRSMERDFNTIYGIIK